MSENNDRIIELLEEILKWLRFMGIGQVKTALPSALDSEKKVLAYHLSDGKNSSVSIAALTGINQPRVTDLWREWTALGLGEQVPAKGGSRFKRSFDLKMFGINVPETKTKPEKPMVSGTENAANEGKT